jgi:hypothetical protein
MDVMAVVVMIAQATWVYYRLQVKCTAICSQYYEYHCLLECDNRHSGILLLMFRETCSFHVHGFMPYLI